MVLISVVETEEHFPTTTEYDTIKSVYEGGEVLIAPAVLGIYANVQVDETSDFWKGIIETKTDPSILMTAFGGLITCDISAAEAYFSHFERILFSIEDTREKPNT